MMSLKRVLQKFDLWIEHLVDYPGCDQKTINIRKTMWIGTLIGLFHVILHTLAFLIFFPKVLYLLINYGYFLVIIQISGLFFLPKLTRKFNLYIELHLSLLLLLTCYIILKLGGIATSAGLIFACLAFVLSSVPLQNKRITAFLFLIFTIIVVISGLLVPWLTVPKEMTPKINAIVFAMNTLSMSILIFYLTISFFTQQSRLEKLESNKLKELNDAKNKLFTNITHEFRTPLTVIQGMTDLIEKNPKELLHEGVQKIRSNSQILLHLVNQMLDLSKIETGVMPIHWVRGDITAYIGYITELFKSMADNHGIKLETQTSEEKTVMDFDADKLLHIISNLISNALKFTPEGGKVVASAFPDERQKKFIIRVEDNGIGINSNHLPFIFDRFYRAENDSKTPEGTGLGLALSKELTILLGGTISAESDPGKGTIMNVSLPITCQADYEEISRIPMQTSQLNIKNKYNPQRQPFQTNDHKVPVLLIVEDSNDVADYLAAILKSEYHIECAGNGKLGFEKALNLMPDIILSDVMMPEMDGIALLEKVKKDIRTNHIPVVLLTAKVDIASRLAGLESGADAYLAKPFDEKELHIVLKNLVEIRKKLHERYASPEAFPPHPEDGFKNEDTFMEKVRLVLEANLEDDEFGITQLCKELAVSRTQLYRKFKSVSNHSIADYFKLLRLLKSRTLLATTKMNVTEVAFASGFKNLSYFSREFTHQFGKNPKEFRN